MPIISVDLASRDYRDIGVVLLDAGPANVAVEFRALQGRGLPNPQALAEKVLEIAEQIGSPVILIDGPQAWKDPNSLLFHSRICERSLNTPAKTGLPGQVKPSAYAAFVAFSIEVFDRLDERGWPRFDGNLIGLRKATVETFPLSAWRTLGIPPLPAKKKARAEDLVTRLASLQKIFNLILPRNPNHDELQALVSGLAGLSMIQGNHSDIQVDGVAPFLLEGTVREGYIVNPKIPIS